MKKRLLASLMALCLIVGLLPTAVLAVEEPQDLQEETPVSEPVPTATAEGATDGTPNDSPADERYLPADYQCNY